METNETFNDPRITDEQICDIFVERFTMLKNKFIQKMQVPNIRILAKHMRVSTSSISRWESGKQIPNIIYLHRIAKFFDVTADYLIGLVD